MINTVKLCTTCDLDKELSAFSIDRSSKSGRQSRCKLCDKKRLQSYRKTVGGFITHLYDHQKRSSKQRGHAPPEYTREELKEWLLAQENFKPLFNSWVASGYYKDLIPSVDRLDDYKGYSLDRIQLVTWLENKLKGEADRKTGVNTKSCKPVLQFSMDGQFIAKHHSSGAAERATNGRKGSYTTICQCCRGELKSSAGFKWSYE